jgi:Ca2+-binding EF-hand superfamily protein
MACAALLLGLAPWLAAATRPDGLPPVVGPKAADDVQDFVYLGETAPVLLRLHLQNDGKSFRAAWDDFIGYLFKQLDTNNDSFLDRAEAERAPAPVLLFNSAFFGAPGDINFANLDANRDGKVTKEELAQFYRANGGAPFQLQVGPGQAQYVQLGGRAMTQNQDNQSEALTEALFGLLDANKDGKLSREELAAAPAVLLKLDEDDDEMISIQELLPNYNPFNRQAVAFQTGGTIVRQPPSPFVMINPGESSANLARQLQTRYGAKGGQGKSRKLTRKDLGLDEATFNQLDADGDGELDAEELARYGRRTADVELTVRVGKRNSQDKAVDLSARPLALPGSRLHKKDEAAVLDLGNTRLELRAGGGGQGYEIAVNYREAYKAQFKAADKDNNGYLDENEARQSPVFRGLFKAMDRDRDGKVFEKEMLAYLDEVQDLQRRAKAACVTLAVSDQGRGLFDLLDTNRDGRLGVREMWNAVKLLDTLDRDGKGSFGRGDIPRSYQLNVGQGTAGLNQARNRVIVATPYGAMAQPPPQPTAGPLWFRKMDRNRDGDVSRREFLGTDEEFRRLDADGDGLISAEEAARADAQRRQEKKQK